MVVSAMSVSQWMGPAAVDLNAICAASEGIVLGRCLAWLGGHTDDAREALSRTWLRAASSVIEGGVVLRDPTAWILTVAYRVCMDLHRERARRTEERLPDGAVEERSPRPLRARERDPERIALAKELIGRLEGAIDGLPPRLRHTMREFVASGEYGVVAQRLGITEVNARKRIQHARAILRSRLHEY
ncbi:MAG: sigma-70 family RNA polymerase sigma factor [Acidobacteriota bacterium]